MHVPVSASSKEPAGLPRDFLAAGPAPVAPRPPGHAQLAFSPGRRHHGSGSPAAPTTPTLARRKVPGGVSDFYSLGLEAFPSGTALRLRSAECGDKDEKPRVMFYL